MSYLPYGSNLRCSRFYPLLLGGYELLTRPGPLSDQLLKKKKKTTSQHRKHNKKMFIVSAWLQRWLSVYFNIFHLDYGGQTVTITA